MPFKSAFDQLLTQDAIIAGVIFCLILLVIVGAVVYSWYRGRRGQGPVKRSAAYPLEFSYIGVLFGVAVFLVISSFTANAKDYPTTPNTRKTAVQVKVTGYQWCWRFHYEGTAVTATGQCVGHDRQLPVLTVPAGEPVRLDITSADVIHAVWVPKWKVKLYAYPDHVQSLVITIPRTGKWIGRCAMICGIYHYDMDFWLRAVPPSAFASYLRTGRP